MSKTTVVYHSGDFDGIFCREIARKFLPDAELIGWNFGDQPVNLADHLDTKQWYVLDLPVDKPFGWTLRSDASAEPYRNIIWIDHHKSAIDSHPANIPGYRIDGVAACRLAWQWFAGHHHDPTCESCRLPRKEEYLERKVSEPLSVRIAGEYDIWDKRDWRADVLQYGLRVDEPKPFEWEKLLSDDNRKLEQIIQKGLIVQSYAQNIDDSICNDLTWLLDWEGLKFLCVNHARFNSLLFAARDKPETGHDALLGFRFDGKTWMVSLYHAKHRTDLDLSQIAVKYGGGGHRGAAGMTFDTLPPFLTT